MSEDELIGLIRRNAEADASYAPYCCRCATMARMRQVERFLWKCMECGAKHDERTREERQASPYYSNPTFES